MHLLKNYPVRSKHSIQHNIQIELAAGKPKKQAIAIALNIARKKKYKNK